MTIKDLRNLLKDKSDDMPVKLLSWSNDHDPEYKFADPDISTELVSLDMDTVTSDKDHADPEFDDLYSDEQEVLLIA
jgi:hypothetical protein